jgi:hypothetical protein
MNLKPTNVPREDNFVPLPMCAFNTLTGMQTNEFTTVAAKLINTSTPCRWVVVYAYNTNGNTVAIGDANAKAEPITGGKVGLGEQLVQGASQRFDVVDASLLYLAVANAGDGVSYSIYT